MTDEQIIERIIEREGGYVNHPADKGGPTKYGIALDTLKAWSSAQANAADVEALTEDQAATIYRERYLLRPGFDRIKDDSLRALVVDSAVHHGIVGATKLLQRALGVPDDGVFGIVTEKASSVAAEEAYRAMCAERVRLFGRIITGNPSQAVFAAGWMNRIAEFIEA